MPGWKIIVTDGLNESGLEILSKDAQVDSYPGISGDELLDVIGKYDAMIVRGQTRVTAEIFSAARRIQVVGRAGVGIDNIDLAAANQHQVTVVNSPLATTQAVAEHVLALMFSMARSIPSADGSLKSGLWQKNQFMGVEIKDKVLGIIGMGNIGSTVAQLSRSLGMQVVAFDPLVPEAEIVRRGAKPVSIQELLSQSDFISIHVPLSTETRGLINGGSFGVMKRGARLICTARGGIVDETALLSALESGQVAGAALDVFAKEPPGMSALVSHPRVIATPHIGAQTTEAQARAAVEIAAEVIAALKGDPLRWKIV
ncbi:MAG: hydroxyacid dehydrogenase [Anaerolineales bacterium]